MAVGAHIDLAGRQRVDQLDVERLHRTVQPSAEVRRLEAGGGYGGAGGGEERRAFRHPPVVALVAVHLARVAHAAQRQDVAVGLTIDRLVVIEKISDRKRAVEWPAENRQHGVRRRWMRRAGGGGFRRRGRGGGAEGAPPA